MSDPVESAPPCRLYQPNTIGRRACLLIEKACRLETNMSSEIPAIRVRRYDSCTYSASPQSAA
jgi:hypothetical protein